MGFKRKAKKRLASAEKVVYSDKEAYYPYKEDVVQDKDYNFFLENIETLYEKYGHKFLAIKDEHILCVYDTFEEALNNTLKTEALGTFLIQECLENREKLVHHFQGNVMPCLA